MSAIPESSDLPTLIVDWVDLVSDELGKRKDLALTPRAREQMAHNLVMRIIEEYGGIQIYIPVAYAQRISERDREIYDAYQPSRVHELCRRYQITQRRLLQIVRRVRAQLEANSQEDLFNP